MNSEFPYGVLGLDKSLDDFRRETFARLEEVHAEYAALGYLPASLNLNRGPARGLIELGNFGRFRLYQDIAALLEQAFPFTAAGKWLDYHAAQILLPRGCFVKAHLSQRRQEAMRIHDMKVTASFS